MMRIMRSINVPAAVVGYSAVVSCRLNIRRRMIEDKQFSEYYHPELDAEDVRLMRSEREGKNSNQVSEYYYPEVSEYVHVELDAEDVRLMRSERKGKKWDNYQAKINAEHAVFMADFERSQIEKNGRLEHRKNSSEYYNPDYDAVLAVGAQLYAELEVLQKLYTQNPMDVQILRKLAATMTGLATVPILPVEVKQRVEWFRESKSLLEKALDINKNDDNVKFELGRAHYYILMSDRSVKWGRDQYVELVVGAYRYFKEVEDKGPEVYKHPMLDVLRRFVWPFMSDLESISRNWKSSSSELNHDNTEQNKEE